MRKPYATSLDDALVRRLKIYAARNDISANDVIESALKSFMSKNWKYEEYLKSIKDKEEQDDELV